MAGVPGFPSHRQAVNMPGPEAEGLRLVLCCDSAFSLRRSHSWLDVCAS